MKKYINNKEAASIMDAARQVESGDSIWLSGRSVYSEEFLNALLERVPALKDVTIIIDHPGFNPKLNDIRYSGSFKVITGISQAIQQTYNKGDKLEFLRASGKTAIEIICRDFGVNTLVAEVFPPDDDGMCELGVFGRYLASTVCDSDSIKKRIAIINSELIPASKGAAPRPLPFEGFDIICEGQRPVRASIA